MRLYFLIAIVFCHLNIFAADFTISATASKTMKGSATANLFDGRLDTRWGAYGNDEFVDFVFDKPMDIKSVSIAFSRGTERIQFFKLAHQSSAGSLSTAVSLRSSGASNELQKFSYTASNTTKLRLFVNGHQTLSGSQISLINLISEVQIEAVPQSSGGSIVVPPPPSSNESLLTVKPHFIAKSRLEIESTLQSWASNWASSAVNLGISATAPRVVGINQSIDGLNLVGLKFSQPVTIRTVAKYSGLSSSVYIKGVVRVNQSKNLRLYLLDIRAPDSQQYSNGLIEANGVENFTLERSIINGFAFDPAVSLGATRYGMVSVGSVNLLLKNNVYRYFNDGFLKLMGTHTAPVIKGNMGLYSGGDDYTLGSTAVVSDLKMIANYGDRHHAKVGGVHNDFFQLNQGAILNRASFTYNVLYRGFWYGARDLTSNGWQGIYMSGGSSASAGPYLSEFNLFINGQMRAMDNYPGGGSSMTRFNTALEAENSEQAANATFPRILPTSGASGNFVTAPSAGTVSGEGSSGLKLVLGSTPNFSLLHTYYETHPTLYTDLFDIRPKKNQVTHPDHITPVGSYNLWKRLFERNKEQLLSEVGFPVGQLFINDFDKTNGFNSSYTGVYNADGDNAP